MQREKKEAEEAAQSKAEGVDQASQSSRSSTSDEDVEKTPAGNESTGRTTPQEHTKQQTGSSTNRPKHQKTRSEVTREATFASLQRALNAAVAGRDQYASRETNNSVGPLSPRTAVPQSNSITCINYDNHEQGIFGHPFMRMETGQDPSATWVSQTSHDAFAYDGLNTAFTSADGHLSAPALDDTTHQGPSDEMLSQNIHLQPHTGEWMDQVSAPPQPFSINRAASDAGVPYNTMQYPLQPLQAPLSRRGSSDELANTLDSIAIQAGPSYMQQAASQSDRTPVPAKGIVKEVDIAARRKRPRPSAIGTSEPGRSLAASVMSPTAKGSNVNYGVRQSKSAQSLNSRYAGVKKVSGAQRSPLNLTAFNDPGSLNTTKADMSSILQVPVVSNSLAPPTPITPETLHHLLPTSPADGGYCLSAQPCAQFFPTTRAMPINIASPPSTPLPADMMSQFSYPNTAMPMSAPAQYTTFPDYGVCDRLPLTARSWADSAPVPSPHMVFQDSFQVQQGDVSPIEYDPAVEHGGQVAGNEAILDMPSTEETKMHDFEIHEFPGQYETHRYTAQKNYVFANKAPTAYGNPSYAS